MSKPYPGENHDDAADRLYDAYQQALADAFEQGRSAGRLGHGAGMCPDGYSDAERNEWNRGRLAEIAAMLDPEGARRAA